jgi:hypothetical protein
VSAWEIERVANGPGDAGLLQYLYTRLARNSLPECTKRRTLGRMLERVTNDIVGQAQDHISGVASLAHQLFREHNVDPTGQVPSLPHRLYKHVLVEGWKFKAWLALAGTQLGGRDGSSFMSYAGQLALQHGTSHPN